MGAVKPLEGRVTLVTGASRGIGRAAAVRMAAAGAQIVAVARNRGALEALDDEIQKATGTPCVLVCGDFLEPNFTESLAESVFSRFRRLDVLVGNAAMLGPLTPLCHVTERDWDSVLKLNLEINWRLIRAFDPLLRRSDAGRAVFVSSWVVRSPKPFWGPYAISKAALEAMVRVYAAECSQSHIRVNILDPGIIRTQMRAQAFPGEDANLLSDPESVADLFVELASPSCERHGDLVLAAGDSML